MPKGRPRKTITGEARAQPETRRDCRDREKEQLREEMQIGARLRRVRREHLLTQEQVAARLSLNRTAYTHYENGVNMPDVLTLARLAAVYGLSLQEFVGFLAGGEGEGDKVP